MTTKLQDKTRHIQSRHKAVKYACNQCDYQAIVHRNLTSHIQSRHKGVKYACNQCDCQFTSQDSLTKHIQSKHDGVKYACDYQATSQGNLMYHIQSSHFKLIAWQNKGLKKHVCRKHLNVSSEHAKKSHLLP